MLGYHGYGLIPYVCMCTENYKKIETTKQKQERKKNTPKPKTINLTLFLWGMVINGSIQLSQSVTMKVLHPQRKMGTRMSSNYFNVKSLYNKSKSKKTNWEVYHGVFEQHIALK